jgi:hypothetical protein
LMNFPTRIEAAASKEEKLAVFQSMDPEAQRILKHAIWRARGVGSRDPDFAGRLIQSNPNDPIIREVAVRIREQIGLI